MAAIVTSVCRNLGICMAAVVDSVCRKLGIGTSDIWYSMHGCDCEFCLQEFGNWYI